MKKIIFLLICTLLVSAASNAQTNTYKIEDGALVLNDPIYFEAGSDVLKPESEVALNYIKAYLDEKTSISLMRIEGHVASLDEAANQALSKKRAMAVCKWLVAKGVDCKRLIPVGFGSTKPVADNSTPDGKAQNTRIVVKNAMLRSRAIGGMPVDGGGEVAGDCCK